MKDIFVFKTNGRYLGFLREDILYSRDGIALAWLEDSYIWDKRGDFRGYLDERNGKYYIFINRFMLKPAPRSPRNLLDTDIIPDPPPNIQPISLSPEIVDGFQST